MKIKTAQGYFFTVSNGRYGRIYGEEEEAEILCETHGRAVVEVLEIYMDEVSVESVDGWCAQCDRLGKPA